MWKHDTFRERKCQTQQSVTIQHSLYLHLWATLDSQLFICTQKVNFPGSSLLASHLYPSVSSYAELLQSTRVHPVLTQIPTHLAPEIPPPNGLSLKSSPLPTVLQISVLRRARGNREGARRDAAERSGYLSNWKVKDTEEKGNSWFCKTERNCYISNIMQKVCTKTSTSEFNIPIFHTQYVCG